MKLIILLVLTVQIKEGDDGVKRESEVRDVYESSKGSGRQTEVGYCTQANDENQPVRISCLSGTKQFCCGAKGNEHCCDAREFTEYNNKYFLSMKVLLGFQALLFVAFLILAILVIVKGIAADTKSFSKPRRSSTVDATRN